MELESALLITVMDRNYDDIVIPMASLQSNMILIHFKPGAKLEIFSTGVDV